MGNLCFRLARFTAPKRQADKPSELRAALDHLEKQIDINSRKLKALRHKGRTELQERNKYKAKQTYFEMRAVDAALKHDSQLADTLSGHLLLEEEKRNFRHADRIEKHILKTIDWKEDVAEDEVAMLEELADDKSDRQRNLQELLVSIKRIRDKPPEENPSTMGEINEAVMMSAFIGGDSNKNHDMSSHQEDLMSLNGLSFSRLPSPRRLVKAATVDEPLRFDRPSTEAEEGEELYHHSQPRTLLLN